MLELYSMSQFSHFHQPPSNAESQKVLQTSTLTLQTPHLSWCVHIATQEGSKAKEFPRLSHTTRPKDFTLGFESNANMTPLSCQILLLSTQEIASHSLRGTNLKS